MEPQTTLEGKVALVTGASRGIGQAIALTLGQQGATVIGTATTDQGAENISKYLEQHGLKGYGMALNVTDTQAISDLVDSITKNMGAPHILVNNAGITRDNLVLRMKDDEWNDIIQTNLNPIFHLSKACLRGMLKAKWGRIISISSVVGVTGNPGQANYSAAKAGVIAFSKSLAAEIASRNITVNVVAPGFIDTDMTRALNQEQRDAFAKNIPMGKPGEAQNIADCVAFLASDRASYMTGQTLHVNGGLHMS